MIEAFNALIWNKLSDDSQALIVERMDVHGAFEWRTPELLVASGCMVHECSENEATLFIDTQGRAAVELIEERNCRSLAEEGFAQTRLLCQRESLPPTPVPLRSPTATPYKVATPAGAL